ncbi:hypothetical protein CC78DRAFT_95840 [Lojkania enalia]|uniref:Chitin-binding type-1 domain-containing protein n=1 Tax=Lojkania enalia TaxID=147567 RepID=A0A9P4JZN8_9PLEO|nr:hypothetical protein CC78DRAFT_95840 [Didymosphaeria enalia]
MPMPAPKPWWAIGLASLVLTVMADMKTSIDGTCGNDITCYGSMFGQCCSSSGHCGSSIDHCGDGCQLGFGHCEKTQGKRTLDSTCGGRNGFTCQGSKFGNCCSQYNFCGSSAEYCGVGCQSDFGMCPPPPPASTKLKKLIPTTVPNAHLDIKRDISGCPASQTGAQTQPQLCVPCEGQGGSLPFCGADVNTDSNMFTPKTCRTVYYEFDISNTTLAPDGFLRPALLVNNRMPGPPIEANWGDTIVVTVHNNMQENGTSIHFHGIRQFNNSEADGTPSITQCPIAPGQSMTYTFVADNYGFSWYHSHFAIQTWMGVMGPMIIHGPTSKEYDADAGSILLQDWDHRGVDAMYDGAQDALNGGPRTMDTGLINGMNTWGVDGASNQTGKRFELLTQFEPGKTYLLSIVNAAIQSTYKFSIDGHSLEVIHMDFTAIKPYKTNILNINVGQRYMVLVSADQPPGDYWMRADNQNACAATIQATDIKGIVRYRTNTGKIPTSTAYTYTGECVDEPLESLVPIVSHQVAPANHEFSYDVKVFNDGNNQFRWYLSGMTFNSFYDNPSLLQVAGDGVAPTGNLVMNLPYLNEWVYVVIDSDIPLPHPIHLHGHDFYVLAQGRGGYIPGSSKLNLQNPARRDTALMPGGGHVVIAFKTDNPGAWLLHCHIGWHSAMGFAMQIIEGMDFINGTVSSRCQMDQTCASWRNWAAAHNYHPDTGV